MRTPARDGGREEESSIREETRGFSTDFSVSIGLLPPCMMGTKCSQKHIVGTREIPNRIKLYLTAVDTRANGKAIKAERG